MNYIIFIPIGLSLLGFFIEIFREKNKDSNYNFFRELAIFISGIGFAIFVFRVTNIESPLFLEMTNQSSFINSKNLVDTTEHLSTKHWGALFCAIQCLLFLAASLVCPRRPAVRLRMSRVYLLNALLIGVSVTPSLNYFLILAIFSYLLMAYSVSYHMSSFEEDTRKQIRSKSFIIYQGITSIALLVALIDHILLGSTSSTLFSPVGIVGIVIATCSSLGIFPFHSWVVPFYGAPRSSIFLPLFCIELGLILFFRLYVPNIALYPEVLRVGVFFSVLGLLYSAICFFGENRLKRMPAYLYLSHISLMMLSIHGLGENGHLASLVDSMNLMIAITGLVAVSALLSGRFGVTGILYPTGLSGAFPELAVCYLICALSLVGFPGTLGFIEEEVMLESGIEQHLLLIGIVTASLTLNGFTCFRLFAKIFYGPRLENLDQSFSLLFREKVVLWGLILILIINGFAPEMLLKFLSV